MDSGPGVPVGEEERIFEKFYRLAVPERSGGTGLGLSIAKGVIEAHGGMISACNSPEGGLRVEVRLPAADTNNIGGTEHEQ
jgi:two-component system sensor histidine kinase KdpD